MKFHLDHQPEKPDFELNHSHRIFLIGSCFSENIGNLLACNKFNLCQNPNGILFNPASIQRCLSAMLDGNPIGQKYLLNRDGVYFSYLHHSSVHDADKNKLLHTINASNASAVAFLKTCECLFITFGTAYVYKHRELNETIANCHKQPGSAFEKSILSVESVVQAYTALIPALLKLNPGLKIVFTVSPVKYLKEGLIENNLSKSTLLLAVNALIRQFSNCYYFPAYELVNDDLRDYRFYREDLAHPNDQAIEYVWGKFSDSFFSEKTVLLNEQIHKLNKALKHRKMINNSEEALKLSEFIKKQKNRIHQLDPLIDLQDEGPAKH